MTHSSSLLDMHGEYRGTRFVGESAIPIFIALIVAINAYSYVMVVSIPLVQSDAWRFLGSFLGRFIEHGFSWLDLFSQVNPNDTALPLQRLFLFFHTRFFGMDFRLEGLLGVLSGIGMVFLLTRASTALPVRRWQGSECWLIAAIALTTLSLNSTNLYTWPLATQWFLPVLMSVAYFWAARVWVSSGIAVFSATLLLGLLLDEVAIPVFISAMGAMLLAKPGRRWGDARRFLLWGGLGLAGSRALYRLFQYLSPVSAISEASHRSFGVLLDPGIWQAAFIPLSDAVIHQSNLVELFPGGGLVFAAMTSVVLIISHGLFWWRCIFVSKSSDPRYATATFLAVATMLLCYGLVLGVVLQRVPEFGFDYLHQPRYVMFYQLNLAALAVLVYRDYTYMEGLTRAKNTISAVLVIILMAFGCLQFQLSTLAWEHAKYLSKYVEESALTLGKVAANPEKDIACPDILTVCNLPAEERRRATSLLVHYKLNLFSPDFQAFHRLYPYHVTPAVPESDPKVNVDQ